jgi:hypothetical protein
MSKEQSNPRGRSQGRRTAVAPLWICGATILAVGMLAVGCGERLREEDPQTAASAVANAPTSKMNVNLDASKLDPNHKYAQSGQFTVGGLFYRRAEPLDATVNVTVQTAADGKAARGYDIDLANVRGSTVKVLMSDDGYLSAFVPGEGPVQFQTSNPNVKAMTVEGPSGPRACYIGKDVLDGQLQFALCDLQTPQPVMTFLDAQPGTTTAGAAGAEGAAPAAPEAGKPEASQSEAAPPAK